MQVVPLHPVISLHHIGLEGKVRSFFVLMADDMQALKGYEGIISNEPARNKHTLVL
jgi:hypothetical protein